MKKYMSTTIAQDVHEEIKEMATKENRTLSNIVETALKEYLQKRECEIK